jgi:transcriptional regulator with XRE-family HTH domain
VDSRREIRDFLTSRRGKVSPEQAGLRSSGRRRVPGLRRSEVAQLANVSVEYYARLERGDLSGASDAVLDALSRALQLDEVERTHLYALARDGAAPPSRRQRTPSLRPSIHGLLDRLDTPAFVMNARGDVLATSALGRALYEPLFASPTSAGRAPNHARFLFLDPASEEFWVDWERAAADTVAMLNAAAALDPYDKSLTELIGELSTRSDEFRRRWARHDVHQHRTGTKTFRHPVVGDVQLTFESLAFAGDDLTLIAYSAEPASRAEEALQLLASWMATETTARALEEQRQQ